MAYAAGTAIAVRTLALLVLAALGFGLPVLTASPVAHRLAVMSSVEHYFGDSLRSVQGAQVAPAWLWLAETDRLAERDDVDEEDDRF